ncbi:MAG: hypothetical protein WD772_12175 [Pseudohongiellaceae bacterium]
MVGTRSRVNAALVVATGLILLTACASPAPVIETQPELVGEVVLQQADQDPAPELQLDIGVIVFSAAPVDPVSAQVSPWLNTEIRAKETQYLPYVLRNKLAESNQWGSVRVLPEYDPSVDLTVKAEILQSDGLRLVLDITVEDSTGRRWLDRQYADETGNRDFPVTRSTARYSVEDALPEVDPFSDLYALIANDLLAVRAGMSTDALNNILLVSQMRYAADLSPETFGRALIQDETGLWQVTSLVSREDPMLARVGDMKLRHFLFIDTVDEYYRSLFEEMQPPYDLWRRYSREQILETRELEGTARGGSRNFRALSQSYDRFRWAKMFEQEFADLALGFNNEVAPAILELNRRVHGLSGSLEEQYLQWRDILRQLFELENFSGVGGGFQ